MNGFEHPLLNFLILSRLGRSVSSNLAYFSFIGMFVLFNLEFREYAMVFSKSRIHILQIASSTFLFILY